VELNGTGDTAYYNYDGSGQRVRKVVVKSGKRTERLYLGGVERYREYSTGGTVKLERWTVQIDDIAQVDTLTADSSGPVANPVPLIRYQYRDHLGSASLETNENGQVISYEEYHPFGTSAYRTAKSGTDLSLKRYRFTNKERDDETGLYYFGVRYYAAWLGRWTSSDPGDFVDGLNMYVYVRNNPVNGVDLEGYETEPVLDDLANRGGSNGAKPDDLVDRGQFDGGLVLLGSERGANSKGDKIDGDYYNSAGEYLGSDGKKDDKVYLATSVTKNDAGIITESEDAELLTNPNGSSVSHNYFKKMAAKVVNEDSNGEIVMKAIANAMYNDTKREGWTITDYVNDPNKSYASSSFEFGESQENKELGFSAVINATTGGYDYSLGATKWDGRDMLAVGKRHYRHQKAAYDDRQGIFGPEGKGVFVEAYTLSTLNYYIGHGQFEKAQNIQNNNQLFMLGTRQRAGSLFTVTMSAGHSLFYKKTPKDATSKVTYIPLVKVPNLNTVGTVNK
jgi:RHS repeat-associated protein